MFRALEFWLYMTSTRLSGKLRLEAMDKEAQQLGITQNRFSEWLGNASLPRHKGSLVWLHARDIQSAMPLLGLINQLNEQDISAEFLITTRRIENTNSLMGQLPENAQHQFLPLDLDQPVTSFLSNWAPDIAIFSGDEFWPRMLTSLAKQNVPVISINTTISDRNFKRWLWIPSLAKSVLRAFYLILAQDQFVVKKLKRLGAEASNIRMTGSMATTKKLLPYDEFLHSDLSSRIGNRSVWLAATTSNSEEAVIINAHKMALRRNRRLLLILHTAEQKRGARISSRHENKNLKFILHGKGETPNEETDVYITDQIDLLATYMRLASVTFCGGSLSDGATLDPFHPASMGSAMIYGPSTGSFSEDYERYDKAKAAKLVQNGNELTKTLNEVLDPGQAASMAFAAWEISSEGGEVSGIVVSEIMKTLTERTPADAAA